MRFFLPLCLMILVAFSFASCEMDEDDDATSNIDDEADDDSGDDDDAPPDSGEGDRLADFLDQFDFDQYLDVEYTRSEPGLFDYTDYYFHKSDCRCFNGGEAHVAVSHGTENKVMLFLEGGGARWPSGGFAVNLNAPFPMSFRGRDEANPLKNWHFVYVPYCDASIHSGDSQLLYDGEVKYHWGLRHTAAAVSLAKELFPDPEKILVAGASAGGFGTYYAWALTKYVYMETDTYIMNDSGVGFFDPSKPEVFEDVVDFWNLQIPDECSKCNGPVQTYIYETFMEYDPQLRIGMFTSYRDWIISEMFLQMNPASFENTLLNVTGQIHENYPDRFKRFFIEGNSHTSYEFLLPEGPNYIIEGTSMYQWIGQLVNEDPAWRDLLE